ncbi:hypothetical protein FE784_08845 [Paenibacillus hemerocallicola]|jgi:glucan phosphoethanolaminetransferase (alkaline phosphatase superfamily)|uniref:Uncharacterized protein n=1 Tax=Paenibacillus hemerocallicola TaxID=1172614 RepID=A0A5C4TC45_9BACL|nr:hypothetical protein [Paenibacillus hemerocallicola]TNJ66664.1 hypothetical protein FE784_08845 [Paenibacillus hemerocallicola]
MNRLSEIIQNHSDLDNLVSLFKHYGVNAQFVAASVIEQFNQTSDENDDSSKETSTETEGIASNVTPELLDDLKQYCARL